MTTPVQSAKVVEDFEDLLHFARAGRCLEPITTNMAVSACQIEIHVRSTAAASWIAYLSTEGFRFDTGVAYRHSNGHPAIEGRRAARPDFDRPAHHVVLVMVERDEDAVEVAEAA